MERGAYAKEKMSSSKKGGLNGALTVRNVGTKKRKTDQFKKMERQKQNNRATSSSLEREVMSTNSVK